MLRLSRWLRKRKRKGEEDPKYYNYDPENNNTISTISQIYDEYDKSKVKNSTSTTLRREYIALEPVYSEIRQIKSYPVSPERVPHEDKGYLSDQRLKQITKGGRSVPYRRSSTVVLVAGVPQHKSERKDSLDFPFQIPENLAPQRSSLIYGVKYEESNPEISGTLRYAAEKPMEDHKLASTLEIKSPSKSDKYDMMLNTDSNTEISDSKSHQKTVIRLRPSSARSANPSESVKIMPFHADTANSRPKTPNKYVHQFPLRINKEETIFRTSDGRLLQPVEKNKIRSSLRSQRESQIMRESIADFLYENNFQTNQRAVPSVYTTSTTTKSPLRGSVSRPSPRARRYSEENVEEQEYSVPQSSNTPVVYAIPAPTRGRTGSILQHSVKSLVTKADRPSVHRKNIRYSVDNDVFSADTRRTSVKQSSPRYVNMEKGQPVLVSEFLNPITSIFVTDLKDPVPKDPLTKPKEYNVWVKPGRNYEQKSPKQSRKSSPRVMYIQNGSSKPKVAPVRRSRSRSYSSRNDSLSSSEEESDLVHTNRSRPYAQRKHHVYTSEVTDFTHPDFSMKTSRKPLVMKVSQQSQTEPEVYNNNLKEDICGLTCNASDVLEQTQCDSNYKFVSRAQQTDEEEIDLFCYPSEKFIKASALTTESGSKLRWRIIIKRGDEK